jgi:hypothetical protein
VSRYPFRLKPLRKESKTPNIKEGTVCAQKDAGATEGNFGLRLNVKCTGNYQLSVLKCTAKENRKRNQGLLSLKST